MKFLHAADLHLDSPLRAQALKNPELAARLRNASRLALARTVDAAIDAQVDALLLAGDVFDGSVPDVASRAALAMELGRLDRAGIPTLAIQGNHDALLDLDRYGPVAKSLILLDETAPTFRIGDASIHGLGFGARHVPESLLPRYPAPEPGRINLGLMHTSLGGAAGHDRYAPCAEADLLAHGYDYWALGHIHLRSEHRGERSLAVMPGIPQGRSIREIGGGSATLVTLDLDGARAEPVPIRLIRFATVQVDLGTAESQAERIERIAESLAAEAQPDVALAARVEFAGAGALAGEPDLARSLAEEASDGLDDVHIETVRFVRSGEAAPPGAVAELSRMMQEDAATPGFRDEAAKLLEEWRRALPVEIRDALDPEELDGLIEQGVEMAVLRLAAEAGRT
ncbi:metallophosphoesterase family protein [Albimonas pacifica]|uniref:DNA repair exonuclease SbcCD nuclease subunit n=1 Tax=Albimonas pacifica TaxID=1114924 RepID=A0A1I3PVH2_9RHOB|nr:DNA repair exonuclease [Albimonas pacifica]SFJ24936.1 DNA repair exonuclease SbcCD nuclease subunit [Albimonas pacifica]